MSRNLKLWNHWIAEVREIALGTCYHTESEDEQGNVKMMSKTYLKRLFNKDLMFDYFKDGLDPAEAFSEETANWSE